MNKQERLGLWTSSLGIAAVATIIFSTVLTCVQDVYPAVAHILVLLGGHHWTGHGISDVVLFAVLGTILKRGRVSLDGSRLAFALAGAAVFGGSVLTIWFLVV